MVRLYSFDFDGTLVNPMTEEQLDSGLAAALGEIREGGASWVINTGRTLGQLREGMVEHAFAVRPDYVITEETALHRWDGDREVSPVGTWNERRSDAFAALEHEAAELFDRVEFMVRQNLKARYLRHDGIPDEIIATTVDEMDWICEWIDRECELLKLETLLYQRNAIYLRFGHRDFHKGSTLRELARELGIPREEVFAVGDSHNDVSMLNGKTAGHVACPANALGLVKTTVRQAGGYVAKAGYARGTLEALRALAGGGG